MSLTAWCIVKATHAGRAFDGEGARLNGGRWNSPGAAVVYTAGSAALAALEMLVHLGHASILEAYALIACTFDDRLVAHVDRSRLPENWRAYPAPDDVRMIGDRWIRSEHSAVLAVPSAIIETDANYLLNPRHRDFAAIQVHTPQPFELDLRLLKR